MIEFVVLGNPKALKRHRTYRRGPKLIQVDPSKRDKDDFLILAHKNAPKKPIDGAISLSLALHFPRPKSHYRTGKFAKELKATAPHYHTSRPDGSNCLKFVEDALNGVYWVDDAKIAHAVFMKIYSDEPKTVVRVYEIQEIR